MTYVVIFYKDGSDRIFNTFDSDELVIDFKVQNEDYSSWFEEEGDNVGNFSIGILRRLD